MRAAAVAISVVASGCTAGYIQWSNGPLYKPQPGNSAVVIFYKADDTGFYQTNVNFNEPGYKGIGVFSFDPVTAAPPGDNTDVQLPEGDYNAYLMESTPDEPNAAVWRSVTFHHSYENQTGCVDTFTNQKVPCSLYKLELEFVAVPGPFRCAPPTVQDRWTTVPMCLVDNER
jgi:hypothetical protein